MFELPRMVVAGLLLGLAQNALANSFACKEPQIYENDPRITFHVMEESSEGYGLQIRLPILSKHKLLSVSLAYAVEDKSGSHIIALNEASYYLIDGGYVMEQNVGSWLQEVSILVDANY